jgi:hypothetical protein
MTAAVPYADQERLIFALGSGEGLRAPRVPLDWVVGVMLKVGARFANELVRIFWLTMRIQ